jgi:hypothetical protein
MGIERVGDGVRAGPGTESVGEAGEGVLNLKAVGGVANAGRTGVTDFGTTRALGGGTEGVADGGVMVNEGLSKTWSYDMGGIDKGRGA